MGTTTFAVEEVDRIIAFRRRALICVTVTVLLAVAVSGFMSGLVDGDLPWPATPGEEATYFGAKYWLVGAVFVWLIGLAVILAGKQRQPSRRRVVAWYVAVGVLGGGVIYLLALSIGQLIN